MDSLSASAASACAIDPSRRDFLRTLAFATGLAPVILNPAPGRRAPLGLQLYTVRDQARTDLDGTLAALGAIGYDEVEFAGLHGHPAASVRDMLERAGLRAPAGHVSLEDLERRFNQVTTDALTLGHRYLIVPWLDQKWRSTDGYRAIAGDLNRLGAALRDRGLGLGYHNHQFEFIALPEGGTGYERLLGDTRPDLVTFELDLFWARDGGADSLQLFQRYHDRFRLVHIKDRAADGSQVTVGRGTMDWPALLTAARRAGVEHWIIEQDNAADPMAFARESREFVRRVEW
jgi:sugar phosphate isomerase/epimerase